MPRNLKVEERTAHHHKYSYMERGETYFLHIIKSSGQPGKYICFWEKPQLKAPETFWETKAGLALAFGIEL